MFYFVEIHMLYGMGPKMQYIFSVIQNTNAFQHMWTKSIFISVINFACITKITRKWNLSYLVHMFLLM